MVVVVLMHLPGRLTSRRMSWLGIGQCRPTILCQTATTGYWSMSSVDVSRASALHFIEDLVTSKSEETRLLSNR